MTWGALARKVRMSIKGKLMPDISSSSLTRRVVIGAGAAMVAAGWLFWHQDKFEGRELTVQAAFEALPLPRPWITLAFGREGAPPGIPLWKFSGSVDATDCLFTAVSYQLISAHVLSAERIGMNSAGGKAC